MNNIERAKTYYLALYSDDRATVRQLVAEDFQFRDPSAPEAFGIPEQLDDIEAFLDFISSNLQGEVNIEFIDCFASNDKVILQVETTGIVSASRVGMGDKGQVKYGAKGITILHFEQEKVHLHLDYFDYPGLASSFTLMDSKS